MSVVYEKEFVIKHVFTDVTSMKPCEKQIGKKENYFNIKWALKIDKRFSDGLDISLGCLKFTSTDDWSINADVNMKLLSQTGEESIGKSFEFSQINVTYQMVKEIKSADLKNYLVDGKLTVEMNVKITKMNGIEEKLVDSEIERERRNFETGLELLKKNNQEKEDQKRLVKLEKDKESDRLAQRYQNLELDQQDTLKTLRSIREAGKENALIEALNESIRDLKDMKMELMKYSNNFTIECKAVISRRMSNRETAVNYLKDLKSQFDKFEIQLKHVKEKGSNVLEFNGNELLEDILSALKEGIEIFVECDKMSEAWEENLLDSFMNGMNLLSSAVDDVSFIATKYNEMLDQLEGLEQLSLE